ncbi:MAG: hydroxyacid-oxoacid transhydrogenase [Tetrasphaera sp.]
MTNETIFTYGAPPVKFGVGAVEEIGHDLGQLGIRRALLITDPGLVASGMPQGVADHIRAAGITAVVFAGAHVEPTDASLQEAIAFARDNGPFDGVIAVGGGSSIDTAKAVNLLLHNPGELMDYVNAPIGQGRAPVNALAPLVAIPTTAGTGAECTTVCVLDVLALKVKTGISHPRLRPALAIIDPALTMSLPPMVTACSGLDILCHALESYTARPYAAYERKRPEQRVPYCGANPIADMWSEKALELLGRSLRVAVHEPTEAARTDMALAATFAGLGFGNAGVHIPHANGYPIAGRVTGYHAPEYPGDEPLVPHGMSVSLTAPETFRFTFAADPERHRRAALLLDPDAREQDEEALAGAVARLLRDVRMPNGIAAVGFTPADVDALVAGSAKQQRLLAVAPREVEESDLAAIFHGSFSLWPATS